jgi:transcription initiation factor IIE alpha subunit
LKYSDSNALSFHCPECDTVLSYLEAMGERTFSCPNCASTTLHPVELSRFFYYGRLGYVVQQQRMLEGGIA